MSSWMVPHCQVRFIGILIENYGGAFPTWLAPTQVEILPVLPASQGEYAKQIKKLLDERGFRSEIDDSEEKLGYRLRNAVVKKIPYSLVIGEKEKENRTVTYRLYGEQKQTTVKLQEFIELLDKAVKAKARF